MKRSTQTGLGVMVILVPAFVYLAYGLAELLLKEHLLTASGWGEWLAIGLLIIGGIWFIYAAIQGMQDMEESPKTVMHNGEQMMQCVGMNLLASRYNRRVTLYLGEKHIAYTPSWREKIIPWHEIQNVNGISVPTLYFVDGTTLTLTLADTHFVSVLRALQRHNVQIEQSLLSHLSDLEKKQGSGSQ